MDENIPNIGLALRKRLPKKPKVAGWVFCPDCGKDILMLRCNYCPDCGQAIDWSKDDD